MGEQLTDAARAALAGPVTTVAPRLLGAYLTAGPDGAAVTVRITEVEAYAGTDDPASHAYRGPTARTAVMFGPAGHLYVYFTYGMHWCANVVCGPDGQAAAVLLRAGEVVDGLPVARARRPAARREVDLARGPARLASCLGLDRAAGGLDLFDQSSPVRLGGVSARRPPRVLAGPRVGITAAVDRPWRFWLAEDPTVSTYRPGRPRTEPQDRGGRLSDVSTQPTTTPPATLPADLAEAYEVLASGAAQILPADGLAERLSTARREGRPLRVKLGIDPSGSDLTLGHAVVLRKLRQFQDFGHTAVLVVGGFTGQVGDPSGRTSTRVAKSAEDVIANAQGYFDQVMRILDPGRTEVVNNADWLGTMSLAGILDYTRLVTVAQLLERDDFARRFKGNQPISLSEFVYPLLQGIDSVEIRADLELGGTDQTFNNLVGRELQRSRGQAPQAVLTLPLLVGTDGVEKMGKSLGNYVAITEPASEQFGKLMSIPDSAVGMYARLCTALPPREVDRLAAAAAGGGVAANRAKRAVARAIVELYHGAEASQAAEARFDAVFKRGEVLQDVPDRPLADGDPVHLPAALVAAGLAATTSAARRDIDAGSVRIDGEQVAPRQYDLERARVQGRVVANGKRRLARLG